MSNEGVKTDKPGKRVFYIWLAVFVFYGLITYGAIYYTVEIVGDMQFNNGNSLVLQHQNYPPQGASYIVGLALVLMTIFTLLIYLSPIGKTKKIFLIPVIIIIFFGVVEWTLRDFVSVKGHLYRPHHILIWEPRPDPELREINSMGLRSEEIQTKKGENEYRILILGDSSAYGTKHFTSQEKMPVEQRFSNILESKLQKHFPDKNIKVINAAVEGYSIYQARNLFDLKLKKLSPDCIILAFNNDPTPDVIKDEERVPGKKVGFISSLLYKSELYLFLKKQVMISRLKKKQGKKDDIENKDKSTWRVPPEDIKKHYGYLIDEIKNTGGKAIIVSMPLPVNKNEENNKKYRQILKEISEDKKCLFVDIFNDWRSNKREDINTLFFDNVHPVEKGHELIGERLYREIINSKQNN